LRTSVGADEEMHPVHRDQSLVEFHGVLLFAGVVVDHKLEWEFLAMGLDEQPSLRVDHLRPDVHHFLEGADLGRHRA
jgi:hypothetical protein